jgi:hypothetical protein
MPDSKFTLDLIHAPDGIDSFEAAKGRRIVTGKFPIASLDDIIASKRATGRTKDFSDVERLEQLRSSICAENTAESVRMAWIRFYKARLNKRRKG